MEHIKSSGGGPWGGMNINDTFFLFLRNIVGQEVADEFSREHELDEYFLFNEFESRKREVSL